MWKRKRLSVFGVLTTRPGPEIVFVQFLPPPCWHIFFTNSKNVFLNFTLFCVRLSQSLTQFAILSRHGGAKMALQDRKFMHQRAAMRMQT